MVGNVGKSLRGSPVIFQTILNLPGNLAMTGLVFCATGLYFLPVVRLCDVGAMCDVLSIIGSATAIGTSLLGGSGISRIGEMFEVES